MLNVSLAFILAILAFLPAVVIFKQWVLIQSIRQQCDGLGSSNAEHQDKVEKLQAELQAAKKKLTDTARQTRTRESAWNMKALEITNLKDRLVKLQTDYDQFQLRHVRETRAAQDELRITRTQRDELKKLVEEQATELTASREFTFMTDKVAAADVLRMVHDLNSAIYQTAMQLISIIPPESSSSGLNDKRLLADVRSRSIVAIGEPLLDLAISKGKDDESLSILAFHSALAFVCSSAISSWLYGQVHETNILKMVYEQIWVNGGSTLLPFPPTHSCCSTRVV